MTATSGVGDGDFLTQIIIWNGLALSSLAKVLVVSFSARCHRSGCSALWQGPSIRFGPLLLQITDFTVVGMAAFLTPWLSVRKLNSTIMVVKATDDRLRCDATYVLDSARDGGVFARD